MNIAIATRPAPAARGQREKERTMIVAPLVLAGGCLSGTTHGYAVHGGERVWTEIVYRQCDTASVTDTTTVTRWADGKREVSVSDISCVFGREVSVCRTVTSWRVWFPGGRQEHGRKVTVTRQSGD